LNDKPHLFFDFSLRFDLNQKSRSARNVPGSPLVSPTRRAADMAADRK